MKKQSSVLQWLVDILFMTAGSAIYAISVNAFTAPNQIAAGGMTGISTMLNYVFSVPIGGMVAIMNVPIILWAVFEIGYKLVTKTIFAIVMMSVFIDLFAYIIPAYEGDQILNALLAGVFEGVGLSLTFIRGATTGGTDMIARLLTRRLRHVPMGKLMLVIDGLIVLVSAFVFGSIDNAVYACIVIFVSTSIIDMILYGTDAGTGKIFFVMSPRNEEIGRRIIKEMDRGVTFLDARGGYSNEKQEMLFCAVRRFEVYRLNRIIREEDSEAFVIVGDAGEISGEGFRAVKSDDTSLKEVFRKLSAKNEQQEGCDR